MTAPDIATGATLYAFTNEFLSHRFSFEELLAEVARRGLGPGVEIVGFQSIRGFPVITDAFADRFRERVATLGLRPTALGINADQEIRRGTIASDDEMVAYHAPQIRAAAKLGFPVVRYQYGTGPSVIQRLVPLAEDLGVTLGLEIHAPHHADHPTVLAYREMYARAASPALGWIPDFSATARTVPPSFLDSFRRKGAPEPLIAMAMEIWHNDGDAQALMFEFKGRAAAENYDPALFNEISLIFPMFGKQDPHSWRELVDRSVHIHGKFFGFDADGHEEAIDYPTLIPLFRDAGFAGTISSEWEGHMYATDDAFALVERHQRMVRTLLAA